MTEIAEGLGAAIEGSLAAKAVEPDAGDVNGNPPATIECPNCGTSFAGNYCPNCGQKANTHRTLTAIAHDLIHGVLHLDGKLSRTLPLLTFKPGTLTRRYINGERARFVSPMSMFLFSVFAMFAVFQLVGFTTPTDLNVGAPREAIAKVGAEEAERMKAEIVDAPADSPERARLEQDLAALEGFIERAKAEPETSESSSLFGSSWELDSENARFTGIKFIDEGIIKKWNTNPGLMLYKLQANAYKFSWLLIPLSIPFVWLIFLWKRRFKAYDHAIFVTYSLAFMSLLFITVSVLGVSGAPAPLIVFSILLIPPIHLYKQLRGTYELSRFSAIWRLLFLSVFIWIVVILFLQALLMLGAF